MDESDEFCIDTLPDDILIKTVDILPVDQLKLLSEVCPRFNEIIFKTPKFTKKFVLQLDVSNPDLEILEDTKREYLLADISNLNDENVAKFSEVFEKFSGSLQRVKLKKMKLEIESLAAILNLLPNIQKLKIENSEIYSNKQQLDLEVPVLDSMEIFNLKSVNFKNLQNIFSKFIHSQAQLKVLKFANCDLLNFLATSEDTSLNLQKLSLNSNYMPPEKEEEMTNFLSNQTQMKEIKVSTTGVFNDSFIVKQILKMNSPGLKLTLQTRNLSIHFDESEDYKSQNITSLKIRTNWKVDKFLQLFPNLQDLELIGSDLNTSGLEESISGMQFLKKLVIDLGYWNFSALKNSCLEFLEVHVYDHTNCLSEVLYKNNPNIRNMIFHFTDDVLMKFKDALGFEVLTSILKRNLELFQGLKIYVSSQLCYNFVRRGSETVIEDVL